MIKVKPILFVFTILIVSYWCNLKASNYGQGLFKHYSKILYGTEVTKINNTYITFSKNWNYEGYLMPRRDYVTVENDTLKISEILGYGVKQGVLIFEIKKTDNNRVYLLFKGEDQVNNFNPKIENRIDLDGLDYWIDLVNKPFYIKYWKFICSILCFIVAPFFLFKSVSLNHNRKNSKSY